MALFDDLSRAMALSEPMGRRRALKVLGGVAAAAMVPGVTPRSARADEICPPGAPRCAGAAGGCCLSGQRCCFGRACCEPDQVCGSRRGRDCCPSGGVACGFSCCNPGDECQRVQGGLQLCTPPCSGGRARCGFGKCCPKGQRCLDPVRQRCGRCPKGREACGRGCCGRDEFCIEPARQRCCPKKGGAACNVSTTSGQKDWRCCKAPLRCARIADETGFVPKSSRGQVCCPPERLVSFPAGPTCCPEGYTGLPGPGLLVGFGIPGKCCPNAQVCGSGASLTCCQKDVLTGKPRPCVNGVCQ